MIVGVVRDQSPRIRLFLPGLVGPVEIEFVVDTGFEGDIALPVSIIRRLDVVLIERRIALMPDGRENEVLAYEAEIEWHEASRTVEVLELAGRPLLGMLLLSDSQVQMDGSEGGEIVIEPL